MKLFKNYCCLLMCLLFVPNLMQAQQTTTTPNPDSLPDMILVTTEGERVITRNMEGKTVIVVFQPDCDHCQREAKAIKEHLSAFKDYQVYFVSPAPMPEIEQFAKDYGLQGQGNVFFAYTDLMNILSSFGGVETPSLYIYGQDRRLVKAFNGETSIGQILLHI